MHFTTIVNILPKLRYFEGRNDIQIGCKSYSVLLFLQQTYERWGHLGFLERGGILEKGEVDLERGMTPLTNYGVSPEVWKKNFRVRREDFQELVKMIRPYARKRSKRAR